MAMRGADVDQKVVQMQFDNAQFESGIRESMSSLSKFENSLTMQAVSQGIQSAATGFTMLQRVAIDALSKVASKIVDTGATMLKALSVDPIMQGFEEYELKMGSVQTIMASTGEELETVNGYLEELNQYADRTIYSFSDMTSSIGKFTNAGVKLDDAVSAIQGISNAAAVAGANSNEASRAMYNFAQALSSGSVKLIDWKSIENANMATVEFKQQLIDTAVAMGTLIEEEGEYMTTTTDAQGKTSDWFNSTMKFNDSLSHQWMTTDVLIQTLSNYSTNVEDMSEAEKDAYREKLKTIGYTEEQIEGIIKLGDKANKAATEVKTATQLWDTLKEAAGSGWSQTFELIIGDFNEAKALWTGVSNAIGPIIDGLSDARNSLLKSWHDMGGRSMLIGAISAGWDSIYSILKAVKEVFDEIFPPMTAKTLVDITNSFLKFTQSLKPSEATLDKIQRAFRGIFSIGKLVINTITAFVKALFPARKEADLFAGGILDAAANFGDLLTKFANFVQESGVIEQAATRIGAAVHTVIDFFLQLKNTFAVGYGEGGGGIAGVFEGIIDVLANFVRMLGEVFKAITGYDISDVIEKYIITPLFTARNKIVEVITDITGKFKEFASVHLVMPDLSPVAEFAEKYKERFHPLQTVWEILKAIFNGMVTVFQHVAPILSSVGSVIGSALQSLFGTLAEAFKNADFQTILDLINGGVLIALGTNLTKLVGSLNGLVIGGEEGGGILGTLMNFLKDPKGSLENIGGGLKDLLGSILPFQNEAEPNLLSEIAKSIALLAGSFFVISLIDSEKLLGSIAAITSLFAELVGTAKLMEGMELATRGLVKLAAAVLVMGLAMKLLSTMDYEQMGVALLSMAGGIEGLVIMVNNLPDKDLIKAAKGMEGLGIAMILVGAALKIMSTMGWEEMGVALVSFAGTIAMMVLAFNTLDNDQMVKSALGFTILGNAMLKMAGVMKILGTMSWEELGVAITAFAGSIVGMVFAFNMLDNEKMVSSALGFTILGNAMLKMAAVMKILGSMSWEELGKSLAGIIVSLAMMVFAFNQIDEKGILKTAAALEIMSIAMLGMAVAMKLLSTISFEQFIVAGLSMAAMLGMMVAISALSKVIEPAKIMLVSAALVVLSVGLIALAAAFKMMSTIGVGDILKTLITMAATLAILGIVAQTVGPALTVMMLGLGAALVLAGVGMTALGVGIVTFTAGLMSLVAFVTASGAALVATIEILVAGLSTVILSTLELLIVGILNILAHSADALYDAIFSIVMLVLRVIGECIPLIVEVLLNTIATLLTSLAEHAPAIVENLLIIVEVIIAGLAEHLPIIIGYLVDFVINIINMLAQKIPVFVDAIVNLIRTLIDTVINVLNGLDMENLKNGIVAFGLMTVMTAGLAAVSALIPGAMAGVIGVGAVIAELTLVLAAIGALSQIPGIEWLAGEGGNLLGIIAEAIGNFVGKLIGGIAEGVMSVLPQIGQDLTDFMTNCQGFINGARGIDEAAMQGVKTLVGTILLLTAADILEGIASFITGGSSIQRFGEEIAAFGPNLVAFADSVKGINGDEVNGAAQAIETLARAAAEIPNEGGLVAKFTGENSLSAFGDELLLFGPKLHAFGVNVAGLNVEDVQNAANVTGVLAEMASKIPNTGGLVACITGDNSLSSFGEELQLYGPKLHGFLVWCNGIVGNEADGAVAVTNVLSEMASQIPKVGGLVACITGDNSLSGFAQELQAYAPALTDYIAKTAGVTHSSVIGSVNATNALIDLAKGVPVDGGLVSLITGDKNSLSKFGEEMVKFAPYLKTFSDDVAGIKDVSAAKAAAEVATILASMPFTEFINYGDVDLTAVGASLAGFAPYIKEFGDGISGLNGGIVTNSTNVKDALNELQYMPTSVMMQERFINSPIGEAGEQLATFGAWMGSFARYIADVTSNNIILNCTSIATSLNTLEQNLPTNLQNADLKKIGSKLVEFAEAYVNFTNELAEVDAGKASASISQIERIADMSDELSSLDSNGLTTLVESFKTLGEDSGAVLMASFDVVINNIGAKAKGVIDALIASLNTHKVRLFSTISTMCKSVADIFTTNLQGDNFETIGGGTIRDIVAGMTARVKVIETPISTICTGIVSKFKNHLTEDTLEPIGENAIQGIINGMKAKINALEKTSGDIGDIILESIKESLDEHSPSRKMYELGGYASEGLADGMLSNKYLVSENGEILGNEALDSIRTAIEGADSLENDLDIDPTIRPVVDLSGVQSGYDSIRSLFSDDEYDMYVRGNLRQAPTNDMATAEAMNELIDAVNGMNNDDVVDQLASLRSDISSLQDAMSNLQVVMDSGALVGSIVQPMDAALGSRAITNGRGRYA